MAFHRAGERALLQIIAAILSLLLPAGVFGSGMDADDDTLVISVERTDVEQVETHVDGLP